MSTSETSGNLFIMSCFVSVFKTEFYHRAQIYLELSVWPTLASNLQSPSFLSAGIAGVSHELSTNQDCIYSLKNVGQTL